MLAIFKWNNVVIILFALVVTACGGGGFNGGTANVRVMHAVADAPRVNVFLDDDLVLGDVDFRAGSAYLPVAAGIYDVRVEAILPGADLVVIDAKDVNLARDTRTTVIATGDVTDEPIAALPVNEPTTAIGAGNFRIKVTHASPDAPPVWVALADPGVGVNQASFVGPFMFRETIGPLEPPAGPYRILVTAVDPMVNVISDNDIVFDSEVTLTEGADLHVVAVTSTVPTAQLAGSPISLVVLDGSGSGNVFDKNTGANLRVVHNSPGAPEVDVFVDDKATGADENAEIVSDLTYSNSAGYLQPAAVPSDYTVTVRTSPAGIQALTFDADLMAGMGYTVIASDVATSITEWVLLDDYRPVATEAKVRLVHGSPSAGPVNIYVFRSADNLLPADVSAPDFSGVTFGVETGFLSLEPDEYDIYITPVNSTTPVISVTDQEVKALGVYTAIARDPDPLDAGDTEFNVILIADEVT